MDGGDDTVIDRCHTAQHPECDLGSNTGSGVVSRGPVQPPVSRCGAVIKLSCANVTLGLVVVAQYLRTQDLRVPKVID